HPPLLNLPPQPFPTRRSSDLIRAADIFHERSLAPRLCARSDAMGQSGGRGAVSRLQASRYADEGRRHSRASWRFGAAFALASWLDRKSTRLNSSHQIISYAVF